MLAPHYLFTSSIKTYINDAIIFIAIERTRLWFN